VRCDDISARKIVIWFVWLNQTNQRNKTNQIKQMNQANKIYNANQFERSPWSGRLWAAGAGVSVIIALIWTMVQLAQASAEQGLEPQRSSTGVPVSAHAEVVSPGSVPADQIKKLGSELSAPAAEPLQGPALFVPEEMVAMFQQRKQDLERREKAVRTAEVQVAILKAEVAQILSKVEAIEKRRLEQEEAALGQLGSHGKQVADTRAQRIGQLIKMYESMPAEEAAARIERMADRKALEILRLLKGKSAGAILAQMKADRAAKLSEAFLVPH
jgi:flagellar motility protein MotE (MotC chaperone)